MAAWRVSLADEFYDFLKQTDAQFTTALESTYERSDLLRLYQAARRFRKCLKALLDLEAGVISPVGLLRYLRPNPDGVPIYVLIVGRWEVAFLLTASRSCVAVWAAETPVLMRLAHGRGSPLMEPDDA